MNKKDELQLAATMAKAEEVSGEGASDFVLEAARESIKAQKEAEEYIRQHPELSSLKKEMIRKKALKGLKTAGKELARRAGLLG